jgi:uncharacterized membrane protein YkgB
LKFAKIFGRYNDFLFRVATMQADEIGHIIQLAIAPVFLLTGVGTNMLVLTNRLARIIDRSRYLEERLETEQHIAPEKKALYRDELAILFRRAKKINRAILLSTCCALLICVVVAGLFIADALNLRLASVIAGMFVLAMMALTGSFIYLLREIWLATEFMNAQQGMLKR